MATISQQPGAVAVDGTASPTQSQQAAERSGIVCEEIYENQRNALFGSFSASNLGPGDYPAWSTADGRPKSRDALPQGWVWCEEWRPESLGRSDRDGWEYAEVFGQTWHSGPRNSTYVRRRRWVRARRRVDMGSSDDITMPLIERRATISYASDDPAGIKQAVAGTSTDTLTPMGRGLCDARSEPALHTPVPTNLNEENYSFATLEATPSENAENAENANVELGKGYTEQVKESRIIENRTKEKDARREGGRTIKDDTGTHDTNTLEGEKGSKTNDANIIDHSPVKGKPRIKGTTPPMKLSVANAPIESPNEEMWSASSAGLQDQTRRMGSTAHSAPALGSKQQNYAPPPQPPPPMSRHTSTPHLDSQQGDRGGVGSSPTLDPLTSQEMDFLVLKPHMEQQALLAELYKKKSASQKSFLFNPFSAFAKPDPQPPVHASTMPAPALQQRKTSHQSNQPPPPSPSLTPSESHHPPTTTTQGLTHHAQTPSPTSLKRNTSQSGVNNSSGENQTPLDNNNSRMGESSRVTEAKEKRISQTQTLTTGRPDPSNQAQPMNNGGLLPKKEKRRSAPKGQHSRSSSAASDSAAHIFDQGQIEGRGVQQLEFIDGRGAHMKEDVKLSHWSSLPNQSESHPPPDGQQFRRLATFNEFASSPYPVVVQKSPKLSAPIIAEPPAIVSPPPSVSPIPSAHSDLAMGSKDQPKSDLEQTTSSFLENKSAQAEAAPISVSSPRPTSMSSKAATVKVVVYENERSGLFGGFSKRLLVYALDKRGPWSLKDGSQCDAIDDYQLTPGWEWITEWTCKKDTPKADEEGWQYGFSFWDTTWSNKVSTQTFVRRRKWVRKRRMILTPQVEAQQDSKTATNPTDSKTKSKKGILPQVTKKPAGVGEGATKQGKSENVTVVLDYTVCVLVVGLGVLLLLCLWGQLAMLGRMNGMVGAVDSM